ncbi:MAG: CRISPR-associated protein Csm3 [Symploca sp. SIO2G7]|nr:CRISPR-associated protein Csm3 [Symploca sp. SIO2G7]
MIYLQQLSNSVETLPILTAVIDTALCVGAGGSSGSLADKPIVRDAERNLLIPASQLKGRLRHECEKIARGLGWSICESPNPQTMCPQRAGLSGNFECDKYVFTDEITGKKVHHCLICQIFGNPALPSRAIFDDLIYTENPDNLPPEVLRPGVTINRTRRTAEDKKLYFLETSPANTQLRFEGKIYLQANLKPDLPDYAKVLIWAGLQHIQALGGSKSVGLGWLHWEELSPLEVDKAVWDFLAQGGLK